VKWLELLSEKWVFEKGGLRENLRKYGATEEEISFLIRREVPVGKKIRTEGERVELNAMTSPQLIRLVEDALIEHGIQKVIPGAATLAEVYRKQIEYRRASKAIEEAIRKARDEMGEIPIPDDLTERITAFLEDNPTEPWEAAVEAVAGEQR
jgi:hypothetical protein